MATAVAEMVFGAVGGERAALGRGLVALPGLDRWQSDALDPSTPRPPDRGTGTTGGSCSVRRVGRFRLVEGCCPAREEVERVLEWGTGLGAVGGERQTSVGRELHCLDRDAQRRHNTARYLGSAIGITVVAVIVTRAGAAPGALGAVSGWNVAALVTAGFSLLGALTVLLARERAAGPSRHPSGPPGPSGPRRAPRGSKSICSTTKDVEYMTDKKVWFITGAGRGMGVDVSRSR